MHKITGLSTRFDLVPLSSLFILAGIFKCPFVSKLAFVSLLTN